MYMNGKTLVEFPSCHSVTHEQLFAGTGNCVQSPFQTCSIASLAWLGRRPPCPLHYYLALGYRDDTHTHPRARSDGQVDKQTDRPTDRHTRTHTHRHTPKPRTEAHIPQCLGLTFHRDFWDICKVLEFCEVLNAWRVLADTA